MTGAGFVKRLRQKGYSKRNAVQVYYDFLYTLAELLAEGESLTVPNFGRIEVFQRRFWGGSAPRWVDSSIQRGETYNSVRFVPHDALKASVCTGIPIIIDHRLGSDSTTGKYRRRKKVVTGGAVVGDNE